jgi:tRNA threonylcarbamoyladenosine biosynthesis protein TsaB
MTSHGLFRAEVLLTQSRSLGPVLGLDTGGPQASLAVSAHGAILASITPPRRAHGEAVVNAIDDLLRRQGLTVGELAAIAVGIGPGSFTGLRIALSYAKGVALATGCGMVGIPSLDALALCALELPGLQAGSTICPVLDARKGEVYAALYRHVGNGVEKLSGEFLAKPRDLAMHIKGEVVYLGDGTVSYGAVLKDGAVDGRVTVADMSIAPPSAVMIAALGAARMADDQADSVGSLQPLYVRPAEAELKIICPANAAGLEVLWSNEKKSSSASTRSTTKS